MVISCTFLDGHDLRTSTAVDLRWQLKRSLDMTAPFYNDVSVLLSFPHSGSRVVSLLMETLSARPAYSLYEHRLSRHGWCKWTQPFGLLSHVACDEEPSVVRHHGINFYESVNPDVAYGLIVILRDYGDHIAEEVAFGRSLGLFELTDFLKILGARWAGATRRSETIDRPRIMTIQATVLAEEPPDLGDTP
eukprot:Skav233037  [mRNA]  locus=scaffold909:1084911:1090427:- [translate_table: standard]